MSRMRALSAGIGKRYSDHFAICLIQHANYFLNRQIPGLEKDFVEKVTVRKRVATARLAHRGRPPRLTGLALQTNISPLPDNDCQKRRSGLREGVNSSPTSPMLALNLEVVRKIGLARAFLGLAQVAARSANDFNLYVATNHMQDAVEIFLFAVTEHIGVGLKERSAFDVYFEQINLKTGKELPFRSRLNALNKTRVSSKHYGVQPERREVQGFLVVVGEFFEEICSDLLNVDLSQISLVQLISNERVRNAMSNANDAFLHGRYKEVLIESRKAFYQEFEISYDVSSFIGEKDSQRWTGFCCAAPRYARSGDYIEKNVKEPTDFIVLDHSKIDADLAKCGLSHTTFWNVWRLTPALFLLKDSDKWIVRHEAQVFSEDGIRERAEYVLHATIDLCLSAQRNREATRIGPYATWTIRLREAGVSLYEKADKKSMSQPLPGGMTEIPALFWVNGLDGGIYRNVALLEPFRLGFVSNDDVDK